HICALHFTSFWTNGPTKWSKERTIKLASVYYTKSIGRWQDKTVLLHQLSIISLHNLTLITHVMILGIIYKQVNMRIVHDQVNFSQHYFYILYKSFISHSR